MPRYSNNPCVMVAASLAMSLAGTIALCQERPAPPPTAPAPPRGMAPEGPRVVSPEVLSDRRIVFRILAPQAQDVRVGGTDIPALAASQAAPQAPSPGQMTKGPDGVWEVTLGPLDPGAYRYNFNVDGVPVIDPRSPSISESNANVWSLVYVPGSDLMDARDVPHGAVASVYYHSKALGRLRRMHVYTPPGYERGNEKYPVFYLLHGAMDCDDSWTSVGRAGFILDNLIAAGKAKPMIIVMPAGHTSATFTMPGSGGPARDEFGDDFVNDIMPYVESHYRTLTVRGMRAIAGLSMGGGQTLNIAMSHLDRFAYIGVFSSGVFGPRRPAAPGEGPRPIPMPSIEWEQQHAQMLDDAHLKPGLKLLWISTGVDDFLMPTTKATVELLKKHGFSPVFKESPGGHTWINWRNYLIELAPQLFR